MKKFYLGLDIGTESVGIACTDEAYRLLRAKGQDLWAVRLFDEAETSQKRRSYRTARRRLARRRQRIAWLQELFAPYLDDTFFIRLNNSGFCAEDKAKPVEDKFSLFGDAGFTDKEFYAAYPTIFHLRSALCTEKKKSDLRLYYLAIHHIIKYRGHFLSEGSLSDVHDITKIFGTYNRTAADLYGDDALLLPEDKAEQFRAIALDPRINLSDKKAKCVALFGKDGRMKEAAALLVGGSAKLSVLFDNDQYADPKSIKFSDMTDEKFGELEDVLGDDFSLLTELRAIYNYTVFEKVLDGESRISDAMKKIYEKHAKDLALLKGFVKNNLGKDAYRKIFRSVDESANYVAYIGYTKPKKKKINVKKCTKAEDFYKFLQGVLTGPTVTLSEDAQKQREQILAEIGQRNFLPKILNADNGLFPHQVNGDELLSILTNLVRDYPAFGEPQDDGYSAAEKIQKIFEFRIPYYVGPLNPHSEREGEGAWIVRERGRITPWNFDDKVNLEASNEKFIRRMTNKCTYLYGKDVLPKFSIYYQAFDVLNQINKLKFNKQPIGVSLKQELFREVFLKNKKVTDKKIRDYLVASGKLTAAEARALTISGKDDGAFAASMSAYVLMKDILGDFVDARPDVVENIILWHTLNTDKRVVEKLILKNFGALPPVRENVKRLKGLTAFKEFGRLSKEFLTELSGGEDPVTEKAVTILGELYHTNQNLNEILFNERYGFQDALDRENGAKSADVVYADLEEMGLSPQVRRGVWQALKMCDEYVAALGRAPDKIFVEVTRSKQDKDKKKRTESRREQIKRLYKELSGVEHLIDELNDPSVTDRKLRSERLYLYFMQLGRCAYTGKPIRLDQLNTELYDVDHIVPRALTKDDGLDNKVLVLREKNREKSDIYPLPAGLSDQQKLWETLHAKKLMSDKKYALLTRKGPLTDDDFNGFINRQLVVTSQTAKAAAELLKRKYAAEGCRIVYSKASNVDDFRQKFSIVKCRETNDLHHARDAYLNIVAGNVYDSLTVYRREKTWKTYNLDKLFDRDRAGIWCKETDLQTVFAVLQKFSMSITRYSYKGKGAFYDETICSKEDTGVKLPRKKQAPYNIRNADGGYKYGGYKSLKTAYFSVITSVNAKGKTVKTVEPVPVYYDYSIRGDGEKLKRYFEEVVGYRGVRILLPRLKTKSLVRINGFPAVVTGVSDSNILINHAVEWYSGKEADDYVKTLVKFWDLKREKMIGDDEAKGEEIAIDSNRMGQKKRVIDRAKNLWLYDTIIAQLKRPVFERLTCTQTFLKNVVTGRDKFCALTVGEQATVLIQCVKFLKCDAELADLSLIGAGKGCGKLRFNKNITDDKFEVIDSSPCGLTQRIRRI